MTRLVYKLGPKIGAGSSGVVYQATLSDGRIVAVKRLSPGHSVLRQHREAHTLARLEHPNIVQFYALQHAPDHPRQYDLITEFVPGVTLGELCRRGRLPVTIAVYIVRQILAALEHIHTTTDLVHRDVSPGNILIGHDGQVKLADFGLTKPSGAARTTTVLRGTPPYVSPEHLSYDPVDGKSDLFVVGIHLYRLLTGQLPFHDDGIADLEEQRPLVPPIALRPDLPHILDAITRKLLEYDIRYRYESATDVLAALPDVAVAQIDLAACLAPPERDSAGWPGWRAAMTRVAGLAAAALLGAGLMHVLQAPTPTMPPVQAPVSISEPVQSTATVCEPTDALLGPSEHDADDSLSLPSLEARTTESQPTTSRPGTSTESTPKRAPRKRASLDMNTPAPFKTPTKRATAEDALQTTPLTDHAKAADKDPAHDGHRSHRRKVYSAKGARVYYPGGRKEVVE